MPVYKRANRPNAAPASRAVRQPLTSDNDITVLLPRLPVGSSRGPYFPAYPVRPPPPIDEDAESAVVPTHRPVTRQVAHPGPAPRPPVLDRSASRDRDRFPRMAEDDRIETVTIAPRPRERFTRMAVFLVVGCAIGFGVERLMRFELVGPMHPDDPLVSSTEETGTNDVARDESAQLLPVAPAVMNEVAEQPAAAPTVHHHHHHAPAPAASTSAAPAGADDASGDPDDMAAAVQALTKAKEEVTLP